MNVKAEYFMSVIIAETAQCFNSQNFLNSGLSLTVTNLNKAKNMTGFMGGA